MTWKAFLETSLYLTVVQKTIFALWWFSIPNALGALVKRNYGIGWSWLSEVYQAVVVSAMIWALWSPPREMILMVLVWLAVYRPAEILIFLLKWVLETEPVVHLHRSLLAFIVNQGEVILCFAVLFREFRCGAESPGNALYNSLRTAVTIGPTDAIKRCEWLVAAEIVVAYLLTVVVIAAVVGRIGRRQESVSSREPSC